MLRVIQSKHAAHVKSYYTQPDYYMAGEESQELAGLWHGKAARHLGLQGEIKQSDWDALCDNRHPETGECLTGRLRLNRTIAYDFNFHVPKSVSLLYASTRDDRVMQAFRESVRSTMEDVEEDMAARVRVDRKNENRVTGNTVWGEFVHLTSRPVNSVPDPHLHAHCVVHSLTFDREEEKWKAGQFQSLKRDAPYYEALFHSRLAHKLSDLGLPIERTKQGWELAGIEKPLRDKFSRRTQQIEEKAREMGIESDKAKDELGAKTREHKQKDLTFSELQEIWQERMTPAEKKAIAALAKKIGGDPEPRDSNASARAIEHAVSHSFERQSVVPERRFLATALKQSVGQATAEQVLDQAQRHHLIYADRNGQRLVTTREVLAEERRMIDFAREGRGTCRPYASHHDTFKRDWLNDDQKKAVKYILESRDRTMIVRGISGTGKSTLLREAAEAIESKGSRIHAFAPSASASRDTLAKAGFEDADTVARLLVDKKLQEKLRHQMIMIDEAGLVGSKTMAQVFDLAEQLDARVLLVGDRFQHGSVERGSALRLLETEAGIKPAEVREIQRQKDRYKSAVKALSEGRVAEGFKRLDDLGWIREFPSDERYAELANDYVHAQSEGRSTLIIAPTHSEGKKITHEVRDRLRQRGELSDEERVFNILENANLTEAERRDQVCYSPGDEIVFHQNVKGYVRGARLAVGDTEVIPFDHADRFQVYHSGRISLSAGDMIRVTKNGETADGHRIYNGLLYQVKEFDREGNIVLGNGWVIDKDWGFFTHGYAVTSINSQGKSVDVALVAQSHESFPASSVEQFYVTCSRARERVTVYTSEKADLLEAVSKSDERLTATELVNSVPHRQMTADRNNERKPSRENLEERQREEFVLER
ncbi:relaxase domain-containing protein [bacterium]|nr:relaxase domain-containing protein [bacterium]